MNKQEAIDYIVNRPVQDSGLGLDRMTNLMDKLGNPQDSLRIIHVAGTNGKGSACAMLTSVLLKANYNVGTYTSPHLVEYNERIRFNNEPINDRDFINLTLKIKKVEEVLDYKLKFFEILTALSFLYFKKKKCDLVVLEVGLGGRLDATNIIKKPLVSVIMNIGLEHTQILGNTIEKIAKEKAGIIKENCPVVVYDIDSLNDIYKDIALKNNAILTFTDFFKLNIISEGLDKQIFSYKKYKNIKLSLLGKHQFYNASVVLETIDVLKKEGFKISLKNIKEGLNSVVWDARVTVLAKEPMFILDGSHNPQCVKALADSLPSLIGKKKITIICGILKDKDYKTMLDYMLPFGKEFICLTPKIYRGLDGNKLVRYLKSKGVKAKKEETIKKAILDVLNNSNKNDIILCFGSLYLCGDVYGSFKDIYKSYLRKKIKKKRIELSAKKVKEYSHIICKKIMACKEFKKAKNIMIYNSIQNEVDVSELTKVKNKVFSYPLCIENKKMLPLIPDNEHSFNIGKYGIQEPIKAKSKVMKDIDLVIVPLVGFDSNLNRLGNGKGYYDRFLKDKKCIKIGVGYSIQMLKEVPINSFDEKLDILYSEKEEYR